MWDYSSSYNLFWRIAYEAKSLMELDEAGKEKAVKFLEQVDELDDVQNVYTNLRV